MDKIPHFASILLRWYDNSKRELPWRDTKDPYAIWLSEIILQQTRIDQGLAYYLKFINTYPTVHDFAKTSEDEILKMWQGLGYYSRARNMHHAAKTVVETLNGKFPNNHKQLLSLKGVGDYTASAIASIAFNLPHATVDGNVYRVLSRIYGIEIPIDTTEGKKIFVKLANELLDRDQPGEFNQALMDFGALQCTPKNPDCYSCPFNNVCVAYRNDKVSAFPVKKGKINIRKRYFNYLIIQDGTSTYLTKRTTNDIWKNLYEFPMVETSGKTDALDSLIREQKFIHPDVKISFEEATPWKKQVLSHQHIIHRFIYLKIDSKKNIAPSLIKVNKKDIFNFAVPKPIEKELENNNRF